MAGERKPTLDRAGRLRREREENVRAVGEGLFAVGDPRAKPTLRQVDPTLAEALDRVRLDRAKTSRTHRSPLVRARAEEVLAQEQAKAGKAAQPARAAKPQPAERQTIDDFLLWDDADDLEATLAAERALADQEAEEAGMSFAEMVDRYPELGPDAAWDDEPEAAA